MKDLSQYYFDKRRSSVLERTLLEKYDEADESYVLMKSCVFWSHRVQKPFEVPVWFITDKASIPWFCQVLIDDDDQTLYAAILHDWLYTMRGVSIDPICGVPIDRKTADKIFMDFCISRGLSKWKAKIAYYALRGAGWIVWNRTPSKGDFVPDHLRDKYKGYHPRLFR